MIKKSKDRLIDRRIMSITAKEIAELRAKTGLPVMEVKSALIEAKGNEEEAIQILRKRGLSKVAKRAERETKSGLIESYVHDGKIGVLVEVLAETDFVAKNSEFKEFVHDMALHIAATNPKYLSAEEIPAADLEKEKQFLLDEAKASGKPEEIAKKMVEGRLNNFYAEVCLLDQPFIKDQNRKISEMLSDLVSKIGEKIVISRFSRFELGK